MKNHLTDIANFIDKFRLVSIVLIVFSCFLTYEIAFWFMSIDVPNAPQAAFSGGFGLALVGLLKYFLENRIK